MPSNDVAKDWVVVGLWSARIIVLQSFGDCYVIERITQMRPQSHVIITPPPFNPFYFQAKNGPLARSLITHRIQEHFQSTLYTYPTNMRKNALPFT